MQKYKILSFAHHHVLPNLFEYLVSVKNKMNHCEYWTSSCLHALSMGAEEKDAKKSLPLKNESHAGLA